MVGLRVEFEYHNGWRYAHIWSRDGVFGHASELRHLIPSGTLVTIPEHLQPALTYWLTRKCGFTYMAAIVQDGKKLDILKKDIEPWET
jgi:hypothetical protein